MSELKKYFFKHFKNEEELKHQYGIFYDLVVHLVSCLTDNSELGEFITQENIDNLLKTTITLKERGVENFAKDNHIKNPKDVPEYYIDIDGGTNTTLNLDENIKFGTYSTNVVVYSPKFLTISQQELDNLKNLDELLNLFPNKSSLKDAPQEQIEYDQDTYLKIVLHELMHAICRKQYFLYQNGKEKKIDTLTKNDLKKATIYVLAGNINDWKYIFDEQGNKTSTIKLDGKENIHEGFTEYLACKIINKSKHLNEIRKNNKIQIQPVYIEYAELAQIIDKSDLYFVHKSYFQDAPEVITTKLIDLCDWSDKLLSAEEDFTKISNNTPQDDIKKIISNYVSTLSFPVTTEVENFLKQNRSEKSQQIFYKYVSSYITLQKWASNAIKNTSNLKNSKKIFIEEEIKKELLITNKTFTEKFQKNVSQKEKTDTNIL